ncbi:phosphotransferase enzyme family protein [Penicillium concentricum]|uniref:Altered inheritance of mitochondria protein 9, mitochondrial n=1 Tax=Penicillium concentricum TaxID=293559 RepID=A0A9W9S9G6_9EURO|nr:phosphotransferase enzyme family protein [Penicillium concentricum]KAJ5374541.1 phosphotransferase enzyme family protein [Penicillium concentricum]
MYCQNELFPVRGRFIVDEAGNLRSREIKFNLNKLARVAADSVSGAKFISIKKYPDGMFNKANLMTMEDGQEVVVKVPDPNAGVPHFTTASEVATMDFKKWLSISFSHYRSLYYAGDVQSSAGNYYFKDGVAIKDSEFAIGPAPGRDCLYLLLTATNEFAGASLTQYLQAVGTREMKAIRSLKPPKQLPYSVVQNCTNPSRKRKRKVVNVHIPKDAAITTPRTWHDDLHDDNIFVDPHNPEKITVDLKDTWTDLPGVTSDIPFPFEFSETDVERINLDIDKAVAGTELVSEVKEKMGDSWPDKGFIEHERYDDCKAALDKVKGQILKQLPGADE